VATGAPVYAPGVIDVDSVSEGGEGDDGDDTDRDPRSSPATPLTAPRSVSGDWSATPTPSRESSCRWSVLLV